MKKATWMRRWMRRTSLFLLVGAIVGVALSFTTYKVSETTAGADFCGSCHTMKPFVTAFQTHVHGGDNQWGFEAKCNDCHLPHDGLAHYLFAKAIASTNDIWVETFTNTAKINWREKLKDGNRFVYDSGCLACHTNLEDKTLANPRAFLPHRIYFSGTTTKTCADCHSNVGHKHLAEYIQQ